MMVPASVIVGRRVNGVAGEYAYTATVTYPGEEAETLTFKSSMYGGPIVMVTPGNPGGVFVSEEVLYRIGHTLSPEWVRAFFA